MRQPHSFISDVQGHQLESCSLAFLKALLPYFAPHEPFVMGGGAFLKPTGLISFLPKAKVLIHLAVTHPMLPIAASNMGRQAA